MGLVQYLGSGIVSGMIVALVTNPIWVIKTRLQLQVKEKNQKVTTHYKGMFDALRRIPKEENFLAFYKGLGPSLLATYHGGIQFTAYELLSNFIKRTRNQDTMEGLESFIAGGLSKIFAMISSHPLFVIRARLQEQRSNSPDQKYKGFTDCVYKIYRNEGFRGFFKGLGPSFWRLTLSSAMFFFLLEKSRGFLLSFGLFTKNN
eukprot:TRINITY_DN1612_c0_g1_i1.p1 TRINITY_DN1612_c0_g1~~TRINITY_DN1612_c0_g1_i1.p1  ORF type:complete len:203 (-),score=17.99 TRINITY_DN1612_c0_g1_i1:41-649(-)